MAIDNVAQTAGLSVVKGPVGIGKCFAVKHLQHAFEAKGYVVVLTTERVETEGSLTPFINDILEQ
jgi:nucleoside-triphosphatase THEP1